jgi:hypothetical protein
MTDAWWRDAVVYEIYVRSFADSDSDGVGDLPGIRSRLPYLRELGVDAPRLELPDGDVLLASEGVSDHLAPSAAAWVRATVSGR